MRSGLTSNPDPRGVESGSVSLPCAVLKDGAGVVNQAGHTGEQSLQSSWQSAGAMGAGIWNEFSSS